METIGELFKTMGISVKTLKPEEEETKPVMKVCRNSEVCSQFNCEHRFPHWEHSEIGTCGEEVCLKEHVMASCIDINQI